MDWLLERQSDIEKKLASRHLEEGGLHTHRAAEAKRVAETSF
jgi:hypothetical protein